MCFGCKNLVECMASLETFVRRLYASLGDRCFVSGTFVIAVPRSESFAQFVRGVMRRASRRTFSRTHDTFQRMQQLERRRCAAGGPCQPLDPRSVWSTRQYEVRLRDMQIGCDGVPVRKGVALVYLFGFANQAYMFLKLESHPAMSFGHVSAAISRYILKRAPKTTLPVRRENDWKNVKRTATKRRALISNAASKDRSVWSWAPGSRAEADAYDSTMRIGMELFVPSSAADSLAR